MLTNGILCLFIFKSKQPIPAICDLKSSLLVTHMSKPAAMLSLNIQRPFPNVTLFSLHIATLEKAAMNTEI